MNNNKNIGISLKTLGYCIQALDQYIVEHIEDINSLDGNDSNRNDLIEILDTMERSAQELKQSYEEQIHSEKIINYPPYEKLVTAHLKII